MQDTSIMRITLPTTPFASTLLVTVELRATRKLQFEYVLIGLFEKGIQALK